MADVHSKEVRSFNMSKIRSKNTKPEIIVRSYLHRSGFRFRLHVNTLPGKPDIVLPKYRTVIQIHGCFWHGHSHCKYYVVPKTRTEWWEEKINNNIANDIKAEKALKELEWKIITLWECQLKVKQKEEALRNLLEMIRNP
jgi:DNA mismatch endonuclease (patch repair protein)